MPYIEQAKRNRLGRTILPYDSGELNYTITIMIQKYLQQFGDLSYKNINEVIGVLECAKLELYRRIAAPYEDKKMEDNGDVFTL
jgi:hypothetical protein